MKHIIFLAAVAAPALLALTTSCSVKEDRTDCSLTAPVTVHVGDFAVSMDDFPTKAVPAADYSGVKSLTLAFYNGATEAYKATQKKGALEEGETFGEFSLSLLMGSYTMVVIGHGLNDGEPAITLTSPTSATFGANPARETFVYTRTVDITSTEAVDISATLSRIVSKLQVASTDKRTANAHSVRMSFAGGGKSFNPSTGLSTVNTGFSNAVEISAEAGSTSLSNSYLFLDTDEQTMDVTIETLDEDGNVLSSKTVENVPFKRNRVTKLTGTLYTNSGISGSILIDTEWLTNYSTTF